MNNNIKGNFSNLKIIIIAAIFAALPPFAIDTYSPAIPNIASFFNITSTQVMITFTTYFIGFAIGILLWGPLSDVYGRKKILCIGSVLYVISSIICPISTSFTQLEFARIGQGFGDAACATVAFAIIRDTFSGIALTKALATLGTVFMVAPIIAPTVGVLLIHITNEWQFIFHFLTAYGIFLLILCYIVPETMNAQLKTKTIRRAFRGYIEHTTNYKFILLALSSAISFSASFSFIGASAIIFFKSYMLSKVDYAALFALFGFSIMLANIVLKRLVNYMSTNKIQLFSLVVAVVLIVLGYFATQYFPQNLLLFLVTEYLALFFISMNSMTLTSMSLEEVHHGFGVASSISSCIKFLFAGLANYVLTHVAENTLNNTLFTQQFILLVMVFLIVIVYKFGVDKNT